MHLESQPSIQSIGQAAPTGPETASTRTEAETIRNQRLTRIIGGLAIIAFLIAGVELAAGYLLSTWMFFVGAGVAAVVGVLLIIAKRSIIEGHVTRGAMLFSIGLFAAAGAFSLVLPGAMGSLALLPVVVVAVFLPFIHGAALMRLVIASWVGGFILLTVNRFWQPAAVLPDGFVLASRTVGFAAILAFTLGLLFHHHQRLRETLEQTEADAEALRKAHHELKIMNETKTRFLNSAAHELRTPLTPILIQLELMGNNKVLTENAPLAHNHEVVTRNIRRLKAHVDELLDIARLQAGQMPLDKEPIALDTVLEDVEQSYADVAKQQNIDLQVETTSGIRLRADKTRLTQVLFNLVSNALKATTNGDTVHIRASKTDHQCTIEVTDTGKGIRNEDLELLFQPFGRPKGSETDAQAGSGLGLFICKGIVEAHGGAISCSSEGPGTGATFRFTLPLARELPPPPDPIVSHPQTRTRDTAAVSGEQETNTTLTH